MTDEEMAEEYADKYGFGYDCNNLTSYEANQSIEQAYLAGLEAGKGEYSKIYMFGRKDERERPCSLCSNPRSICVRCERFKKPCYGSDVGVYIGECKDFIYKEVSDD